MSVGISKTTFVSGIVIAILVGILSSVALMEIAQVQFEASLKQILPESASALIYREWQTTVVRQNEFWTVPSREIREVYIWFDLTKASQDIYLLFPNEAMNLDIGHKIASHFGKQEFGMPISHESVVWEPSVSPVVTSATYSLSPNGWLLSGGESLFSVDGDFTVRWRTVYP